MHPVAICRDPVHQNGWPGDAARSWRRPVRGSAGRAGTVAVMGGVGRLLLTIVVTALAALPLALSMWALLDAARRPGWAWALAGRNQAGWMAAILMGFLTVCGGVAVSGWYLWRVRPVVARAEDGDLSGR